jgi:hypothetical protein
MEGVYAETSGVMVLSGEAKTSEDILVVTNATANARFGWGAASAYRQSLRAVAMDVVDRAFVQDDSSRREYKARDSYSRDDAVARAGTSTRAMFVSAHEAGEYPEACQFKLHAYVVPGEYSSDDVPQLSSDDEGITVDILDRQTEDMSPLDFTDMSEPASMTGKLVSENCGLVVHFEVDSQKLTVWYGKARLYAYMMMVAGCAQAYALVQQIESSPTQASMIRISLASVGLRAVIDSYYCLTHLTAAILVDKLFMPFGAVAMCYFVLFSILEMRLLVAVWRARRPHVQGWMELRVDIGAVYSRFYGGFIFGLFLMYWLSDYFILFVLLMNSYWLPQIVRNAYHNQRQALKPWYVVTTSYARLIGPLYIYGCPTNFMRIKPNYLECFILVAWTTAQAAMLLVQQYVNPRFGFPEGIFPEVYDYHRKVSDEILKQCGFNTEPLHAPPEAAHDIEMGDVSSSSPDCVICMNAVDAWARNERMVTPCNHFFHTKCLTKWMDIKQECPTCRGALPPM